MENVNLPVEKACEPVEEAHQPFNKNKDVNSSNMSFAGKKRSRNQNITFAEPENDEPCSQSSSAYKDALSQPATGITHRQKLVWLQKRRGVGLWVACDECQRWRYLPHTLANHELPKKWYCRMNPDKSMADCSVPEAPLKVQEEEDLIHSIYSCGSVVWARMAGWPYWPAMVDDCPDTEQFYWLDGFSDIPTYYNVVFFDAVDVTRAWIAPGCLKPYESNYSKQMPKDMKTRKRLEIAMKQAEDALSLPIAERLAKHSFIARYPGDIVSPKTVSKKEIMKHQRILQKKFNIKFPVEASSESEEEVLQELKNREPMRGNNVIILGTPKRSRLENAPVRPKRLSAIVEETINSMNDLHGSTSQVAQASKETIDSMKHVGTSQLAQASNLLCETPETALMDISKISEVTADGKTAAVFKEPNSMIAQLGSASIVPGDNAEKCVIPESQTQTEEDCTDDNDPTFQVSISTSSSDDFEF